VVVVGVAVEFLLISAFNKDSQSSSSSSFFPPFLFFPPLVVAAVFLLAFDVLVLVTAEDDGCSLLSSSLSLSPAKAAKVDFLLFFCGVSTSLPLLLFSSSDESSFNALKLVTFFYGE